MCRSHWLWAVPIALASAAAQAQVRGEGDGPAPVNSQESISAGASDQVGAATGDGSERGITAPKVTGDEHAAGTYAGVSPGGPQAPAVSNAAGQTPATVTWPGFQMRPDGTSRVFFQSTAPVLVQTSVESGKFIVKLPGAKVAGDINRLPLETRFFNTPVTKVTIAETRAAVVLTLWLRAQVTPHVSAERGASGYSFTYIDLPAGSFLTDAEKAQAAPPAPAPPHASKQPVSDIQTPTFLEGDINTAGDAKVQGKLSGKVDTSMDHELPPSIKASTKAQAGLRLGK